MPGRPGDCRSARAFSGYWSLSVAGRCSTSLSSLFWWRWCGYARLRPWTPAPELWHLARSSCSACLPRNHSTCACCGTLRAEMSTPDPHGLIHVPEAVVHGHRRVRLPLVWIIPALAALIGGWIAVRAVLERGPTIRIRFQTADGLEPGKTAIRYRSVEVGQVRTIVLAPDHRSVLVTAEMVKDVRSLLSEDTRFWVVRPRIAAGGVSGLGTLISGSFIGMDVGKS